MYFGLQMFGAGKLWQEDPAAFPEKVQKMGFAQMEPCVFLGGALPVQIPGIWDEGTFCREAGRLQNAGIQIPSLHVFAMDWDKALPDMQRITKDSGVRQFVLKCPEQVDERSYAVFATMCVRMADALAKENASLLLHNEKYDIEGTLDGKTAFEWSTCPTCGCSCA